MKTAAQWIEDLELARHSEGGWFRRVYESELTFDGSRPAMTSIYYLLEGDDFSAFHKLKSDEQWHFYTGSPITIHEIDRSGKYESPTLGQGRFQHTVRAGNLFGATVEGDFALVGCTVVPGFDFSDFDLPPRGELLQAYPQYSDLILRLTR
ncbi:MAG: cupin domain-containing protein [Pontiella sp.]